MENKRIKDITKESKYLNGFIIQDNLEIGTEKVAIENINNKLYTCGEVIGVGKLCYKDYSDGKMYLANNNNDLAKNEILISIESGLLNEACIFSKNYEIADTQFNANDIIYLDINGLFTNVIPTDGKIIRRVGYHTGTKFIFDVDSVWMVSVCPIMSNPAQNWYGSSNKTVCENESNSNIVGDPFIIRDDANDRWIMYYFEITNTTPIIITKYKTLNYSEGLTGTWGSSTQITSLNNFHKFVFLVDEFGKPVKIDNLYHGYASYYSTSLADKEIYHFTSSDLLGAWTQTGKVIAKGVSEDKDAYFADTPYALYIDNKINLYYMGAPSQPDATYEYATRILLATSDNPEGAFIKDSSDVLPPSTTNGDWDYGWLGGVQIRNCGNGVHMMIYNAGDTRATMAGSEPPSSSIGYAYSYDNLQTWVKNVGNPIITTMSNPSVILDNTNAWRGHLVWDHLRNSYTIYYNTGASNVDGEIITYGNQNMYRYNNNDYNTTMIDLGGVYTPTVIPGTRINLPVGKYRLKYIVNGAADATIEPCNVEIGIRRNGIETIFTRIFTKNYAYENGDIIVEDIITLESAGYVDATGYIQEGTPAIARLRALRIFIEKLP